MATKPKKKTTKKPVPEKNEKRGVGHPLKFPSAEALQAAIDDYFESCYEDMYERLLKPEFQKFAFKKGAALSADMFEWVPIRDRQGNIQKRLVKHPGIVGLASHLGTNRQTLLNYENRDEFFDTIKNAKVKIEAYAEQHLYTPKIAAGVIFNLKNNFSWKDEQHTKHELPEELVEALGNINSLSNEDLIKLADAGQGGTGT
jgi:hypothetical protein